MTQLPESWIVTKLANVAEIHDNLREPVNARERAARLGPYPYYGATGQVGWIDGFRQDGEYVLLGEDGAPFFDPTRPKAYLINGKAWVNNHAHVLKAIEGVCENRYLLHALNHVNYRGYANGTTRLKLTQGAMLELPIRLAPLNEQRRIVEKAEELLSDLDAGLASLHRVRENLKRYRAAALKAAVDGRLTEIWRAKHSGGEPASELLQRMLAERRKTWEHAELKRYERKRQPPPKGWRDSYLEPIELDAVSLPPVHDGWCWASVDQLVSNIEAGKSFKCEERPPKPGETGVVKVSAVTWGTYDDAESKTPFSVERIDESLIIREGDFLFSRANTIDLVGACVIAKSVDRRVMLSDKILRFRIDGYEKLWLLYALRSRWGRREIESASSGNQESMRNISQEKLRRIRIPLPPLEEQREIVRRLEVILSSVDHSERELDGAYERARNLHQSILKRAFEGRLVPHDPNDEPARELIATTECQSRDAAELVVEGKRRMKKVA